MTLWLDAGEVNRRVSRLICPRSPGLAFHLARQWLISRKFECEVHTSSRAANCVRVKYRINQDFACTHAQTHKHKNKLIKIILNNQLPKLTNTHSHINRHTSWDKPEPRCRAACPQPSAGSSRTRPAPASSSFRGAPWTPPETGCASWGPSHRWSCSCTGSRAEQSSLIGLPMSWSLGKFVAPN